jgi:Tfp pilus assembly protein PilF
MTLGRKGYAYSTLGDNLRALEELDAAIAADPTLRSNLTIRASVKEALGDKAGAAADRAAAAKLGKE